MIGKILLGIFVLFVSLISFSSKLTDLGWFLLIVAGVIFYLAFRSKPKDKEPKKK